MVIAFLLDGIQYDQVLLAPVGLTPPPWQTAKQQSLLHLFLVNVRAPFIHFSSSYSLPSIISHINQKHYVSHENSVPDMSTQILWPIKACVRPGPSDQAQFFIKEWKVTPKLQRRKRPLFHHIPHFMGQNLIGLSWQFHSCGTHWSYSADTSGEGCLGEFGVATLIRYIKVHTHNQ